MTFLANLAWPLILSALTTLNAPPPETEALIELHDLSPDQYHTMAVMGLDIVERRADTFRVIAPDRDLTRLQEAGLPYDVIAPDAAEYYRPHTREAQGVGGFPEYYEIADTLLMLGTTHPDIVAPRFSIGQSVLGNDLWCLKISDNPTVDEDEPEVLYISLIHAREPAGMSAVLGLIRHLIDGYGVDPEITDLVNTRELYFIPVQNPDGYIYNAAFYPDGGGTFRKNQRDNGDGTWGVDLNRNYGYQWGYDDIGSSPYTWSETYRGPSPFSEPETQAVRDFINSRHFTIIRNFHTYSDLEIWPPGYDRFYSDREGFYANLGDSLTQYNGYFPGVSWTLYPTNGDADDWAWGDTISKPRTISLTVEIGTNADGFWPDPSRIPQLVQENIFPNIFLARIADNPYRIGPPRAPFIAGPGESDFDYTINWHHDDPDNPAAFYNVIELRDRTRNTDDAEIDYGDWDQVNFGIWTTRAHSGTHSWHEKIEFNALHALTSRTPYEVLPGDSLVFWLWYDIQTYWDYFYAQVSTDGGRTYTNLANDLTTNQDPANRNHGNGITGQSSGWVRAAFSLADYEGRQVTFRLAYITDEYGNGEGVYIDDIQNCDRYGFTDTVATGLADTTYSVTDQPWGDYWYRVEAVDSQNQVSPWSELAWARAGGDYVAGDADGSGVLNISDLTYLVANLFQGGPEPQPLLRADADCSGAINVSDLTILVATLFQGAPPPSCF